MNELMVDLARIMYFRAVRHSIDYFFVLASVHSMRSAWQHVREIVADSVFVWDIKQVRDICTRNIIFWQLIPFPSVLMVGPMVARNKQLDVDAENAQLICDVWSRWEHKVRYWFYNCWKCFHVFPLVWKYRYWIWLVRTRSPTST